MLPRRTVCAAMVAATLFASPGVATASSRSDVVLGFSAAYSAPDGTTCTHRGIDLELPAGEAVLAPLGGTVTFAGRVPGPHGGSVLAVTLDTASGRVSLLPLSEIGTRKGDRVAQGEPVGSVAESGDPSSAGPHLHMGLRRGNLYVDPAVLIEAAAPAPEPQPQPQPRSAPQVSAPKTAEGGRVAPKAVPTVTSAVPASSLSAAPVSSGAPAVPTAPSLPTGVSLAPEGEVYAQAVSVRPSAQVAGWPEGASAALSGDGMSALAMKAGGRALSWLRAAGAPGFAGIAAACAACVLLLGRKALEGRVTSNPPVSDRLGRLLQQLRAGDTLRGLTSCPGPLPSQSRGRLAQRR